jgi:hypothetical protein
MTIRAARLRLGNERLAEELSRRPRTQLDLEGLGTPPSSAGTARVELRIGSS